MRLLFVSLSDKLKFVHGNMIIGCLLLYTTAVPPGGWASLKKQHIVNTHQLNSSYRLVNVNKWLSRLYEIVQQADPWRRSEPALTFSDEKQSTPVSLLRAIKSFYGSGPAMASCFWVVCPYVTILVSTISQEHLQENVFKFGTSISLGSRVNWAEFVGQRSLTCTRLVMTEEFMR